MIDKLQFEKFLNQSETSILDFKKDLYDFDNDKFGNEKFLKDIISFSNTIRNQTSYIVFGILEKDGGILDLIGLTKSIDDSILQNKAKDNIYPRANFSYYTILYKEMTFGILEFPITKFEIPLSSTRRMKGLEPGKFYYRNGTSNTEATGLDSLNIAKWLDSLQGYDFNHSELNEKISNFIIRLSNQKEKLSVIISELLSEAKKFKLTEIEKFCIVQIKGIKINSNEEPSYRKQKVFGSFLKADFNSNPYIQVSQSKVRNEMMENEDFYRVSIIFPQTLLEIEDFIHKFSKNNSVSMTMEKSDAKSFFDIKENRPFFIYCLEDDYNSVYNNIRQKAIDLLMEK